MKAALNRWGWPFVTACWALTTAVYAIGARWWTVLLASVVTVSMGVKSWLVRREHRAGRTDPPEGGGHN